jgi:WD40 repeat protein
MKVTKHKNGKNYSHLQARNDIEALVDGLLSTDRQDQLEAHLSACLECLAYQEEFLKLEMSLNQLFQLNVPEIEYTPAENQQFRNQVKAKSDLARTLFQSPQWLHIKEWMRSLAWGGALTILMVGMAWVLGNTRLEDPPPIDPPLSLALSLSSPPGSRFTLAGYGYPANQVAFSPDGAVLASAYDDGQVALWRVADQESYLTLNADSQSIISLIFAPNGPLLTLGKENSTLKVWEPTDGQLLQTVTDIPGSPLSVGISQTGEIQFRRQPNELILNPRPGVDVIWATRQGRDRIPIVLPALAGEVVTTSLSPDGKILATGSKTGMIRFWEIAVQDGYLQGTLLARMEGHTDAITSLTFHPEGQWLVSASEDGTARVWRVSDGAYMYMLLKEDKAILSQAFSPNGTALAISLDDGTVYLWLAQEK